MMDFYEIRRMDNGRYQYGADGLVIGECRTAIEAVAEIEKLQRMERGERHDQGKTTRL